MFSYLPLAHVMGRLTNMAVLSSGASVGNFGGDLKKLLDDLQLLRPTIMPVVPRILNRIYDTILNRVNGSNFIKRGLF